MLVLETARGGLKLYGPGFRGCHVGIVTNLYEDHLGFNGIHTMEQMAEVKSAIPRAVRRGGTLVLSGDDPRVRDMARKSAAQPVYFVMEEDYRRFDRVFFLRDGSVWRKTDDREEPVIPMEEIPIASMGLQPYNVANAMAVLAGAEGMRRFLPLKGEDIRRGLKEFGTDPADNPGRFHMLTLQGERFLIFYGKNPASCRLEVDLIKKIKEQDGFERVVGVIAAPGNRLPAYYDGISRSVASVCDLIFLRPPQDKYLRGRSAEEISRLLSRCMPREKVVESCGGSIPELIGEGRRRLGGRILYVLFTALYESGRDLGELLAQAEVHHRLVRNDAARKRASKEPVGP